MVFIYILLGFILVLLLSSFLMAKNYHVEQSIVIPCPPGEVMKRVANLNDYAEWNPFQKAEPAAGKEVTGTPGQPGHRYAWKGKKIGMGSLTLRSINDKHLHFDLEFAKPWKSKASDNWLFEPWGDGGETKVTWENNGELPWPMGRLMGVMITRNLNRQFATGLKNLKELCEKKA